MIVDVNILLHAVDRQSPHHLKASAWLGSALMGDVRVGIPWQTLGGFQRTITHPRATQKPLSASQAQDIVDGWLAAPPVWVPPATERTASVLAELTRRHHITGNLVPDAQLAALAIENGVAVVSSDTDFARFAEVRWINPLA